MSLEGIKRRLEEVNFGEADGSDLIPAGVLLLIYLKDGELCVLLNKRTNRVEHHKGEISFPGGGRDPEDQTLMDTALREAYEEMGIEKDDVEVICQLDRVSTRSGFAITPFVGTIPSSYPFKSSASEVAEVIEVPLASLMAPDNRIVDGRVGVVEDGPNYSYTYGEHVIWGATARILTQLFGLISPN